MAIMPLRVDEGARLSELQDMAAELLAKSTGMSHRMPLSVLDDLRLITSIVNTYSSNLIENNDTRPAEIKKAFDGEFPTDQKQRRLMQEALAAAQCQLAIDRSADEGKLPSEITPGFLLHLHRTFFESSREELIVKYKDGREIQTEPGEFRREGVDVEVGRHVPPFGSDVSGMIDGLCAYYEQHSRGAARRVVDLAAFHHRLLYVHPFADGNGRTIRMATHARLHMVGVGGSGLWSISRGLARGRAEQPDAKGEYKAKLASADFPVQSSSTDGRGPLSRNTLVEFTEWFLEVAIDQVSYMADLYDLLGLAERLEALAVSRLKPSTATHAMPLLRALLMRGEMERSQAWAVIGQSERTGRNVVKELIDEDLLKSPSERGKISLELFHHALFPDLI